MNCGHTEGDYKAVDTELLPNGDIVWTFCCFKCKKPQYISVIEKQGLPAMVALNSLITELEGES